MQYSEVNLTWIAPFLAYFPYSEKIKVGLCVSVCLCIPLINFWMPEPFFMKLSTYIMVPQPISMMYFINPSRQFLCLCVCIPLSLLGNGSEKSYRGNEYTHNRRIVGLVVFYAVHIVSKESKLLLLPRTSCYYFKDRNYSYSDNC
jgi:hypothetical protein